MMKPVCKANCIILMLLLAGLFLPETLFSQQSELFKKVSANDLEGVKTLIAAGTDLNEREDFYNMTPLMWALNSNLNDMALLLINEGADINLKASNGTTALLLAAMRSSEVTELLLSKEADISARSDNGAGALTNCTLGIISGWVDTDLAILLLSEGADIDEPNTTSYYGGYTPLFWAVEDNNEALVKFLIDHGANVNARANNGKTPLDIANGAGFESIVKLLKLKGAK
jgi:ankyrin repeat protein